MNRRSTRLITILTQLSLLACGCGRRWLGSHDGGAVDLRDEPVADLASESSADVPADMDKSPADVPDERPEDVVECGKDTPGDEGGGDEEGGHQVPLRPESLVRWEPKKESGEPIADGAPRITYVGRAASGGFTLTGYTNGDVYYCSDGAGDAPLWTKIDVFSAPGSPIQMPDLPVSSLSIGVKNTKRIWTTFTGDQGNGHKVWTTQTGGQFWNELTKSTTNNVLNLSVNPLNEDVLYIVSTAGLYRSIDAGENWDWWSQDDQDVHRNGAHISATGFAHGTGKYWTGDRYGGIWVSNAPDLSQTGAIRTWAPAGAGTPPSRVNSLSVIVDEVGEHVAAAFASTASDGVWVSDDGGQTWRNAHGPGLPPKTEVHSVTWNPRYLTTLYALTSDGAFRTDDGGAHWW